MAELKMVIPKVDTPEPATVDGYKDIKIAPDALKKLIMCCDGMPEEEVQAIVDHCLNLHEYKGHGCLTVEDVQAIEDAIEEEEPGETGPEEDQHDEEDDE